MSVDSNKRCIGKPAGKGKGPLILAGEKQKGEKMKTIPLLMTVHELDGRAEVWFEPSSPRDTEMLANSDFRINEGNWVVLVARINRVKRIGGYRRGENPPCGGIAVTAPDDVRRYEQFGIDIAEIYLGMGIPDDNEIKTHARAVRRERGMDRSGIQRPRDVSDSNGNDPQTHPPTQSKKTERS